MKRRYKLLILLAGWWFAGIFIVPQINWLVPIAKSEVFGLFEGLLFVACLIGSLIWAVWPKKVN